jgi:hypothetical protein
LDVFSQTVPLLVGVLFSSCLDELKRCRLFQTETKIVSFFEMFSVGSHKVNHIAAFDEVALDSQRALAVAAGDAQIFRQPPLQIRVAVPTLGLRPRHHLPERKQQSVRLPQVGAQLKQPGRNGYEQSNGYLPNAWDPRSNVRVQT